MRDDESGFVKNGELPDSNVEDFKVVLRITGMSLMCPKLRRGLNLQSKSIKRSKDTRVGDFVTGDNS